MEHAHHGLRTPRQRGSILVSTLWILLFLAFLAVALRVHVAGIGQSTRLLEETASARFLAGSALEYSVALIRSRIGKPGGADRFSGSLQTASGDANIQITSEALRIDLNTAQAPLIVGLLAGSGATPAEAEQLAAAMIAMRPADATGDEPAFAHVAELADMPAMPPSVAITAARFATVSSGLEGVRLDALPDGILNAIPGLPSSIPALVEAYRNGRIEREALDAGLAATPLHTTETISAWRLLITVEPVSGRSDAYGAVVAIPEDPANWHQVVEWRRIDAFDTGEGL